MREKIRSELERIEKENDVRILFAVESGIDIEILNTLFRDTLFAAYEKEHK